MFLSRALNYYYISSCGAGTWYNSETFDPLGPLTYRSNNNIIHPEAIIRGGVRVKKDTTLPFKFEIISPFPPRPQGYHPARRYDDRESPLIRTGGGAALSPRPETTFALVGRPANTSSLDRPPQLRDAVVAY